MRMKAWLNSAGQIPDKCRTDADFQVVKPPKFQVGRELRMKGLFQVEFAFKARISRKNLQFFLGANELYLFTFFAPGGKCFLKIRL